jgi:c-di-GMP-binding flagellar brake protein YcgR
MQNILNIGDKVDVVRIDKNGKVLHPDKVYASQLMDFIDDKTICIIMPLYAGNTIMLNPGEKYKLTFYTSKGLFQCNCVMLSPYREDSAIIAALKILTSLERIQRRQYYRLECVLDIEYRQVTQLEMEIIDTLAREKLVNDGDKAEAQRVLSQLSNTWLNASITDLSGGGARFNSYEPLNPGDKVKIKLNFVTGGELKKLLLGANVIASEKLLNHTEKYEHRVAFTDIGKADREDLIKFVFEQERKRRKNQSI